MKKSQDQVSGFVRLTLIVFMRLATTQFSSRSSKDYEHFITHYDITRLTENDWNVNYLSLQESKPTKSLHSEFESIVPLSKLYPDYDPVMINLLLVFSFCHLFSDSIVTGLQSISLLMRRLKVLYRNECQFNQH